LDGGNVDFALKVPHLYVLDAALEVDAVGVVEVHVAVGEEGEGCTHQDVDGAVGQLVVHQLVAGEQGKLTKELDSWRRVVVHEDAVGVVLLDVGQVLRSLLAEDAPHVLEYVHFLDGEIEPLTVGLIDGLFELFKVSYPIFVGEVDGLPVLQLIPRPPLFPAQSRLFLLLGIVPGPGNHGVLVGVPRGGLDDVQLVHFHSDEDDGAEQSECTGRRPDQMRSSLFRNDFPPSIMVDELNRVNVVGKGLRAQSCAVTAGAKPATDIDLDHDDV
jgi:hypothetical protein